ncbi:MAG: glycoside hydrolase family 16 protein [Chitinophagaceae bacterium]
MFYCQYKHKKIAFIFPLMFLFGTQLVQAQSRDKYELVWADEFNKDGLPDTSVWSYEKGFVRNEEAQWYQKENTFCRDGFLIIEARREKKPNPLYVPGSNKWRESRPTIDYSSSCVVTKGKKAWQYGLFEMRARIDVSTGLWPAWWMLGINKWWPENGETDIMEYYRDKLLANFLCADKDGKQEWHSNTKSVAAMGGEQWASKFHTWKMEWTEDFIEIFVDDVSLNRMSVDSLVNKDGSGFNPYRQPHYMLLDFAIGGTNGGDPSSTTFPRRFEVDYIRVYQQKK